MEETTRRRLERMLAALKIVMIVTVYFSICALIILVIIGARP